jgi:hypothetical protein
MSLRRRRHLKSTWAKLVAMRASCRRVNLSSTVTMLSAATALLDPYLDDYGAAYPGFLILNPKHLAAIK